MFIKKRVLIGDANLAIRQLLGFTLGEDDFQLFYAGDGEEALRVGLCEKPHLALLEEELPVLSGGEVCRLLKKNIPGIKVILFSSRDGDEAGYGTNGRLVKPFSPLALLQRVYALLEGEEEQQQRNAG
ncbi:MAG: response regulator [Chloroflexi bacterium]|nr:response regulator [Chloroflexota bacterium]